MPRYHVTAALYDALASFEFPPLPADLLPRVAFTIVIDGDVWEHARDDASVLVRSDRLYAILQSDELTVVERLATESAGARAFVHHVAQLHVPSGLVLARSSRAFSPPETARRAGERVGLPGEQHDAERIVRIALYGAALFARDASDLRKVLLIDPDGATHAGEWLVEAPVERLRDTVAKIIGSSGTIEA
jgi:hypothetical protein